MSLKNYQLRYQVKPNDLKAVEEIIRSTRFFREDEIVVAVELVQETLEKGKASGYDFVFLESEGKTIAYACYGAIPCSLVSYDLYWIATHNDFRGHGLGSIVLTEVEKKIKEQKGLYVYIETSSKELYTPTQKFYEKNHYEIKAIFENFYDIGDGKVVYVKKLH